MTVPVLTYGEFIKLFTDNGFIIACDEYWDGNNRIIVDKNGYAFPLQFKSKYFYPEVVIICREFGITPPADHLLCFEQEMAYRKQLQEDMNKKENNNKGDLNS